MGSIILLRSLVLALSSAYATAGLTPLSAADDDNDCALYLSGPGRTSSYDYSINLLKGNFGYEGQHTCITYDAVNQAYLEARNRIVVSQPKGDWKPEDFASVGELILDISINLARRYGLTYEEIEKGLPLIDTSRTLIREVCPPVFSHVECRAGKYRRIDGLCNNLQQPTWGATNSPFQRLIGPLFADGINAPRISHTGQDLPLSRVVSRTMHPDEGFHDHAGTVMVIAWGQFMDHDYTLTGTPLDPRNRNDPEECCKRPPHLKHPYCNEIRVPDDDYFYRLFNVKCIDFVRGFPSPRPGCRLGSRVPFNTLTGVLDGNTVYGVTDKFARKLRTGYGGLLRMNPVFKEYGLKDLLPLKLDIPDEGCTRPNKNMYCFEAGEIRVNEQLVLTVMHTLMAREHNRVAEGLAAVNPHWDDETLYQEARRINIAEIQHITYNEFLPILLGKDVMEKFGLVLQKEGYWEGYDPHVNPDVIDAFAAAAYRFGHSLLPTAVERWSKAHKFIASKRLSDLIRRPYDLYRAGVLDEYVMGLMNQVAQAMDDSITQEVTNHLFKKVGARFGMDLVSFNMQRGREFGLPGYMEFRKFCGLPGAESFQDLFGAMSNETVMKYQTIFEHPIDVDLWSGGVSERPLPGSMLGPTFACIIATQFSYSRRGDRFWFELPNQPSSFTPEQLHEIRKSRLARIICDNTDIIDTVQLYPMVLPDHELNPRVPCRSGIIPSMDFNKWAEPAPGYHGTAKHFITEALFSPENETGLIDTVVKETVNVHNTFKNCETNSTTAEQKICEKRKSIMNQVDDMNMTLTSRNQTDQLATLHKCFENSTFTESNCNKTYSKTKDSHSSDTVLKYVQKRNEKEKLEGKTGGHYKNALSRRKRHAKNMIKNARYAASVPVIVSYKTNHVPIVSANIKNTANVIQGLADFNIETLHDDEPKNISSPRIDTLPPKLHLKNDRYPHILNEIKKENVVDEEYKRTPPNVLYKNARYPSRLPKIRDDGENEEYERPKNVSYRRNHEKKESNNDKDDDRESRKVNGDISHKAHRSSGEIDYSDTANAKTYEESAEKDEYSLQKKEPRQEESEDYHDDKYDRQPYIKREEKENGDDIRNNVSYRESEESKEYSDSGKNTRPYHEGKEKEDYHDDRNANSESVENKEYEDDKKNEKVYHNSKEKNVYKDSRENEESYNGSSEKTEYRDNERNTKPYSDSGEREDYHDKTPYKDSREKKNRDSQIHSNEENYNSRETDTESFRDKERYESKENNNSEDNKSSNSTPERDSNESREQESNEEPYSDFTNSKEKNNDPLNDNPKYFKSRDKNEKSKENISFKPVRLPFYHNNHEINQERRDDYIRSNDKNLHQQESNEPEEEEEIIAIMTKKKNRDPKVSHDVSKSELNSPLNVSSPNKIQEVDLSDFSYETIHVNDKGKVVPSKDTHENYGISNTAEPLTTTPLPGADFKQSKKLLESLINVDDPIEDKFNTLSQHTIKINHGEIKPVVEINTDSGEVNEESENNKETINSDMNNEDTSLETLLGVKVTDDYEQNDKLVEKQLEPETGRENVKQEVERIPLNYNHDKDTQNQSAKEGTITTPEDTIERNPDSSSHTEGTLDTFTQPARYDDHLNTEFDNEPLKLPEIKLPEDILSYAYERLSTDDKNSAKPRFYHYSDEYVDELSQKHRKRKDNENDDDEDEEYHGYYGYLGDERRSDYKSKNKGDNEEEDEDEDLYEKFVRERFGKKPFKNHGKSEKLVDLRPKAANTEFFNTLRQVLKKADNVQKEAEKSGDPNAGYMWTLEYGQPLL